MRERAAITVHLSAPWQVQGQELRAPAALLTEGTHCGSGGCRYYSADLLRRTANRWNNIPVTLGHPADAHGPISIMDAPDEAIGRLENARFERGALRADIVVPNADSRRAGLLQRISEVSTGMFPDPPNGYEVEDLEPDHLAALLPGERGACSWEDGCGVRVHAEAEAAVLAANALMESIGADEAMKRSVSVHRSVLYEPGERRQAPDPMLPAGVQSKGQQPANHTPPRKPAAQASPEPLLPTSAREAQRQQGGGNKDNRGGPEPMLPTGRN